MAKAENKKKAARVADGPRAPGFARSVWETLGILFRPLIPLTTLFIIYAGISYLLWRPLNGEAGGFESQAQARLTAKALREAIYSQQPPPGISRQDFEQIAMDGVAAAANRSVFEPGLTRKLAQAYEHNSWVERVREVRLRYPARIELEIDFRKPFARTDRNVVLDRNGFVLNLSADSPAALQLPLMTGLLRQNLVVGKRASEKFVAEGLDLIAVIRDVLSQAPARLRVASLEQTNGRWRVQTDRGPAILWGEYTDDPPIDEPRTNDKATLLRRRLCESKDPTILEYVNVYDPRGPVKRK